MESEPEGDGDPHATAQTKAVAKNGNRFKGVLPSAVVTRCGRICYQRRKINLSQVFAGQRVGVKQTAEHIWLVTFMDYDLGYFDDETYRLEPIGDPFGPRLLPMSPE